MALGQAAGFGKVTKASLRRKITKPLIEKRRRARINSCLEELKTLLGYNSSVDNEEKSAPLSAINPDSPDKIRRHKLEKADILEMTVKFVRDISNRNSENIPTSESLGRFEAGYHHCVSEVTRFVHDSDRLPSEMQSRLLEHLRCGLPPPASSTPPPELVSARNTHTVDSKSQKQRPVVAASLACIPFKVKFKLAQRMIRDGASDESGPIWRPW